MKVRVLHPTIIDSQWLQIDDVVEVENEKAQPYVETGLIEVIDDAGITPNEDNDGDENPPDEDGDKGSKSGKGK